MYETPNGNECQNYLEKLIRSEVEGRIVIWGHKHKVVIEDGDAFHNIAKGLKINELERLGGIYYTAKIQNELWTICLEEGINKTFLDKYGKEYQIN